MSTLFDGHERILISAGGWQAGSGCVSCFPHACFLGGFLKTVPETHGGCRGTATAFGQRQPLVLQRQPPAAHQAMLRFAVDGPQPVRVGSGGWHQFRRIPKPVVRATDAATATPALGFRL
jgi:hypothetical protein